MDDKSKEFLEATGGDAREAQTQPPQTAEAEREAAAPIAEEAAKLAPILRSLCEGPSGDPEEMYEPDFEPSDGDCYVVRAAELLELLAAALSSRQDVASASIAGLESAGGHLAALVDEAQGLLTEVVAYARDLEEDTLGGQSERGEVPLMDRADDWLAARPALSSRPVQGGERVAVGWQRADGSLHKGCPPFGEPDGWEPVYTLSSAPVREPLSLEEVRSLPRVNAPEIDGEESDGTPRYWRSRPYVSLTQLERLLRHHGITKE